MTSCHVADMLMPIADVGGKRISDSLSTIPALIRYERKNQSISISSLKYVRCGKVVKELFLPGCFLSFIHIIMTSSVAFMPSIRPPFVLFLMGSIYFFFHYQRNRRVCTFITILASSSQMLTFPPPLLITELNIPLQRKTDPDYYKKLNRS